MEWLAWYLELPTPGEGVAWRMITQSPWPENWPLWGRGFLAFLVVGVLVWAYRRQGGGLGAGRRSILILLRACALLLVGSLLAEPALTVEQTSLPPVAVLVDTSASMSFPDGMTYPLPTPGTAAGITRLEMAKRLLTVEASQWLDPLKQSHEIRFYTFDEKTQPLEIDSLPPDWKAVGSQSRLASAVKSVLAETRGTPPVAMVLLTDGISSAGDSERLSAASDILRRKGVQLHAVALGSQEPAKDLAIEEFQVSEFAFLGDPVLISGRLKSYGYAGRSLPLQIRDLATQAVLAEQTVEVSADGIIERLEPSFVPAAVGDYEISLEVPVQPGELNDTNNRLTRTIRVRDQQLRVLLIESSPRYEFRFLKQLLERERTIKLETILQEADLEYVQEDKSALSFLPVSENGLRDYDVIIMGDIAPGLITPDGQQRLLEYVRDQGGGMILIAGPRYNPVAFGGTPLEILLPFSLDNVEPTAETPQAPFRPRLTLLGQKGNSLFRFADQEAESLAIWNAFPALNWLLPISRLKPGAMVYAEHPHLSGENGPLPVLMTQRIGSGKIFYHATDELWRWRYRVGDLYYARYWVQAIRTLISGRTSTGDQLVELTADRLTYEAGESVTFRLRFLDDRLLPAETDEVTVMLERAGAEQRPVPLTSLPQAPTIFEGRTSLLPEGRYQAWLASPSLPSSSARAIEFQVESPQRELEQRVVDQADLQLATQKTFGRVYKPEEIRELAEQIPSGKPIVLATEWPQPLWSRWEPLILLVSLLTTEWLLRKRWKLV